MQRIDRSVQPPVWRQTWSAIDTSHMLTIVKMTVLLATLLVTLAVPVQETADPQYTSDGQLQLPEHYREWVYLTSGFDMSYTAPMDMGDRHIFDNVFVSPASYQAFQKTGTWPDKTELVLEQRNAQGRGSINQKGNYQGKLIAIEVHVKDEKRFPGKWAFFGFGEGKAGKMIPASADCYSCHADHGAVDTTFVQFYPTLLPIAGSKGTLSAAYLKEIAAQEKK
jgi:Cytochrome P460